MTDTGGLSRRRALVDLGAIAIGAIAVLVYSPLGAETALVITAYGLLWGTSTTVVTYALSQFAGVTVGSPGTDDVTGDGGGRAWGIFTGMALESEEDVREDTGWLLGEPF